MSGIEHHDLELRARCPIWVYPLSVKGKQVSSGCQRPESSSCSTACSLCPLVTSDALSGRGSGKNSSRIPGRISQCLKLIYLQWEVRRRTLEPEAISDIWVKFMRIWGSLGWDLLAWKLDSYPLAHTFFLSLPKIFHTVPLKRMASHSQIWKHRLRVSSVIIINKKKKRVSSVCRVTQRSENSALLLHSCCRPTLATLRVCPHGVFAWLPFLTLYLSPCFWTSSTSFPYLTISPLYPL